MPFTDMISYFVTVFAIAIAPGPVVLMLLVRAASQDTRGALQFGLGFALGGVSIITAVCFGLSTWFTEFPALLDYSQYVMMAYILWLAVGIWKGGYDMSGTGAEAARPAHGALVAGIVTCFISPYMMILFPLVLPGMINLDIIQMPDFLFLTLLTFLALVTASVIVVVFAAQVRRLIRSQRGAVRMNRSLASLLVVGGAVMSFG